MVSQKPYSEINMAITSRLAKNLYAANRKKVLLQRQLERAEESENSAFRNLTGYLQTEFEHYLNDHPELPKDEYKIGIYGYSKHGFKQQKLSAQIILSHPDEPDMHDVMGFTVDKPIEVSRQFAGFIEKVKPLEMKVLWYHNFTTPQDHPFNRFYEERERRALKAIRRK
jgi:hypothetical protein